MNAIDALTTVAEIAIAVAGFAGIVAVFKSDGKYESEEMRRIIFLVMLCATVVITALLPFALSDFGLGEIKSAAISSGILGIAAIILGLGFVVSIFRRRIQLLFPKTTSLVVILFFAVGSLLLASALSLGVEPSYGLLLGGQIMFILQALWIFAATIIWVKDQ